MEFRCRHHINCGKTTDSLRVYTTKLLNTVVPRVLSKLFSCVGLSYHSGNDRLWRARIWQPYYCGYTLALYVRGCFSGFVVVDIDVLQARTPRRFFKSVDRNHLLFYLTSLAPWKRGVRSTVPKESKLAFRVPSQQAGAVAPAGRQGMRGSHC